MSSALLWYRSPEHTFLLPPSTAHRPGSAPARDTAPGDNITPHISQGLVQFPYVFFFSLLAPFSPQFLSIQLLLVTILSHRYNSRTGSGETKVESPASSETQPNQAALILNTARIQPGCQSRPAAKEPEHEPRVSGGTASAAMQCPRPLRHLGGQFPYVFKIKKHLIGWPHKSTQNHLSHHLGVHLFLLPKNLPTNPLMRTLWP
jgi:hypothetical protein